MTLRRPARTIAGNGSRPRGDDMTITSDSTRNFPGPDGPTPVRWWRSGLERRWWTLIAVCGATFMLLVDIAIVQVAFPTIHRDLGGSFAEMQLVIDAYALTLAAL